MDKRWVGWRETQLRLRSRPTDATEQEIRNVECERGEVEVEIVFDCRPQYAQRAARVHDAGTNGLRPVHSAAERSAEYS